MKNFYLSSASAQTALLAALFLTLLLSLFLLLASYGRQRDKWKGYLHLSVFLFFLIVLSVLAAAFSQITEGEKYKTWLPLPMWLLWCITFAADFLILWDVAGLLRQGRQSLSRDSIKQALDMLPSGICYFTSSGSVKLCNRQMGSLFRTLSQSDLQNLAELRDALSDCDACSGVIRLSQERQTYLFPDGRAWRYRQTEVKASDGATYTEAIFSDISLDTAIGKPAMEIDQIGRYIL